MGAGVLMFIDSFLPWFGISHQGLRQLERQRLGRRLPGSRSTLLVIAVAGIAAARIFAGAQLPAIGSGAVTWSFILGSASVVAALFVLLRWVTLPSTRSQDRALHRADPGSGPGGLRLPQHRRRGRKAALAEEHQRLIRHPKRPGGPPRAAFVCSGLMRRPVPARKLAGHDRLGLAAFHPVVDDRA